tara:strand:+ start:1459 stop:2067 length:609 start_codon:yes stop_codon:yes gene_type:complete
MATTHTKQMAARLPWSLVRNVAPSNRAVDLNMLKRSVRLSTSDDTHDEVLYAAIDAATEQVEHDTSSALITQTFKMHRDAFPRNVNYIYIPIRPIQTVEHVKYRDSLTDVETTFTNWYLDVGQQMIVLNLNATWPSNEYKIVVSFTAGYGDEYQSVPTVLRQAIVMQAGRWFQNPTMDLNDIINTDAPYNRLIARFQRADYP